MFGKPSISIKDWIGTCAVGGGKVDEDSVSSFAQGLRSLMSDEELRVGMGKVAMEFCRLQYSKKNPFILGTAFCTSATICRREGYV